MTTYLDGSILHLQSPMFKSPEAVELVEMTFTDFLILFFKSYNIPNVYYLIDNWDKLKEEFNSCFKLFILAIVTADD